jgi:hypothetical protein
MTGRSRKVWLIVAAVVLVLAIAALVIYFVVFRNEATPVQAMEGSYAYATSGYETTDALTGGRHEYPAATYLTIEPGGCGTLVRWQALEQRWDEWDYCADGSLAGRRTFHEWFQISNLDTWTCSPPVPTLGEPGAVLTGACTREATGHAAAATDSLRFEVIGYETLAVATQEVETLHVRMDGIGNGGTESTRTYDTWYLPGTFLIVRQTVTLDSTTQSMVGLVHAQEQYRIDLISLTPTSAADAES